MRAKYIDRDGDIWQYGLDRSGEWGYLVEDGLAFPFEADDHDGSRMTFEEAMDYFGLVRIEDLTPAYDAFRRLRDPRPAGVGNLVAVDRDDLELILRGWEQWYRTRKTTEDDDGTD